MTFYDYRFFLTNVEIGVWYDKGNIIVFVDRQEACDNLFR